MEFKRHHRLVGEAERAEKERRIEDKCERQMKTQGTRGKRNTDEGLRGVKVARETQREHGGWEGKEDES